MGWRACITKLSACHPLDFGPFFGLFVRLVGRPEVRPALGGEPLGLGAPPRLDLGVVAGGEHLRDRLTLEDRWPRVLRIFKQSVGEAFLGRRGLLAHDAGQQPHAGIEQRQRGDLAAGEHEIAERNLFQSARLDQPLVDALETCRRR